MRNASTRLLCLGYVVTCCIISNGQVPVYKTGTVSINNLQYAYIEKGTGPLVIAFHGFPDIPLTFHHQMEALSAAGYRVIAPYMRGYYPTDTVAGKGSYHFIALISDAVALVKYFTPGKDEKAILLGHDWGAITVYGTSTFIPEKISHIITMAVSRGPGLSSSFVSNHAQQNRSWYIFFFQMPYAEAAVRHNNYSLLEKLWDNWSPGWKCPRWHMDSVKATFSKPGVVNATLNYYRHTFGTGFSIDTALRPILTRYNDKIKVPALYIHGKNDGCIGIETSEGMEASFSGPFEKQVIEKAGHFVHLEQPGVVNNAILTFLKKHEIKK